MKEQEKIYSIRFHGIDIIEKLLFKTLIEDEDNFNFEIKVQSIANNDENIIVTFVSVEVKRINKTDTIAKIMVGFGYLIEDFENVFVKDKENKYIIPTELENLLKTISISTMRGIMFSEFRGTQLHKAILPIIMTNTLVPIEEKLIDSK